MPIVGAVVLWLVTGSILSLLLAALGPLIAVAAVVDGRRATRRERRRAQAEAAVARVRVSAEVESRHTRERRKRWALHPDVVSFLGRDSEIWRATVGRSEGIVVGAGEMPSEVQVTGGTGDPDAAALRSRAGRLRHAPVVLPLTAGIAVVGPPVVAAAVHRALVLQLCLAHPPGALKVLPVLRTGMEWAHALPHARCAAPLTLALVGGDDLVPPEADIVFAVVATGAPIPPSCSAVVRVSSPTDAHLDYAGEVTQLEVEAVGLDQAMMIAGELSERAARTLGIADMDDEPALLSDVIAAAGPARRGALPAAFARAGGEASVIDLVADGPHAVVAGVTGSGKSELLISWILALADAHSTREVSFLLADFKGGTAFDGLKGLPHVTGVITDLDGAGARRAIESLRAEVRWREAELARVGARDVLDPRVEVPRLVIVVDEFAALLGEHPELHAVFGDVAARGRALGMHLILGTQRVSGVIRDSLLANCSLRISLRVADGADSRAVVGVEDAAMIPGTAEGRGLALVRRACDTTPRHVRIALSSAHDVQKIVQETEGPLPRRPWLPALPSHLSLDEVRAEDGMLVLGLADEPEQQRQRAVGLAPGDRGLLVVGGPGAGKSTALETLASQAPGAVIRVPSDAEGLWDTVAGLVESPPARGSLVVIDDLDAASTRLPHDHAHELLDRLERFLRGAAEAGVLVVAAAHRLAGPAARLADLLPRRLVLATSSRAEHIAAGGEVDHYSPDTPPGRGRLGALAVQVALPPVTRSALPHAVEVTPGWHPSAAITALVTRRPATLRTAMQEWAARGIPSLSLDDYVADPSVTANGPVVISGDPDEWQRHWRVLTTARSDYDLVIDTSCAAEFRTLTGSRALPPYAEPGRSRAWLMHAGADPIRIVLS